MFVEVWIPKNGADTIGGKVRRIEIWHHGRFRAVFAVVDDGERVYFGSSDVVYRCPICHLKCFEEYPYHYYRCVERAYVTTRLDELRRHLKHHGFYPIQTR